MRVTGPLMNIDGCHRYIADNDVLLIQNFDVYVLN